MRTSTRSYRVGHAHVSRPPSLQRQQRSQLPDISEFLQLPDLSEFLQRNQLPDKTLLSDASLFLTLQSTLELLEFVPKLPHLFLTQKVLLLVVLELFLKFLNGLLDVLGIHGLLLVDFDLVARLIEDLVWALLLFELTLELQHPLLTQAARTSDIALFHNPFLRAHTVGELLVVADDHHTSLESLEATNQCTKAIAIEVVGWLVQDNDVGVLPAARADHHLDPLPVGERGEWLVAGALAVKAEILERLLDTRLCQRPPARPSCGRAWRSPWQAGSLAQPKCSTPPVC